MASPRRSSAPQVEYGATNNAHHRHQVRLIESSSEDDDDEDEHKLQIDLSSAEDDTSSLESRDHNDDVVPTTAGESSLASESHSNPSNFDPLQSLQMLVRSPFAQGQISSAADASVAKGCESIPAANATASSNFSISTLQQQSSLTALPSNAQSTCAISLTSTPVLSSPVNAVLKSSSVSGTTDVVAPLTTKTYNDGVCGEEEDEEEEEEGEGEVDEEDDEDDGANRVSDATIQRVLKKLNAAAIDEINLRTLQELPSEEAFSFNRFRKMLSNHSQFETLPNLSAMVGAVGTFPPRQNLAGFVGPELQTPVDPFSFSMVRNPPALTVIPKLDMPSASSRPSRRRSPPPMVPISSFRGRVSNKGEAGNNSVYDGFADCTVQSVATDGVFDMLKRLGTDVAVEPRSPPQFPLEYEENDEFEYYGGDDDDDEDLPYVLPECILSTEPIVTKVVSLPPVMSVPGDQAKSVTLSRVQPPPPSLIPINRAPSTARFVPILPREPPPAWNIHVNQTPIIGGAATSFSRQPSNLFPANQKFSFNRVNSTIRKPKKQKLPNQSHFTKLANSLVLPANAPRRMDPVLVAESVLARAMRPQSSARLGELEIIKVGPSSSTDEPKPMLRPPTPPHLTFTATSTTFAQQSDMTPLVLPAAPASVPPPPLPPVVLPSPTTSSGQPPVASASKPNFFEFSLKKFANATVMTKSQRKLYGCCVCSTVYHKMFSLKKHFYRTHVNPFCISRQDALKYDIAIPPNSHEIGSRPLSESYRCDTCQLLFGDHEQLRRHVGEHQPSNYEHANRYRCSGCNFVFRKEKVFTRHLLECAAAGLSATSTVASDSQSVECVSAVLADITPSKAVDGVFAAQLIVPSDEKAANDDEPAATSSGAASSVTQSSNGGSADETDEVMVATGNANMMCLFCEVTFKDNTERQKHVLQNHHPKRKQQTCAYCKKKDINDLRELLQHICEVHNKKYFGCAKCKIRFKTKEELTAHRQESHTGNANATEKTAPAAVTKPKSAASVKTKNGRTFRCSKCLKLCKGMTELLSHRKTAHKPAKVKIKQGHVYVKSSDSLVTRAKHTPGSTDDIETEFYRKISLNVNTNLECYLDGKLDQKAPTESKCVTRSSQNNNFGGGCSNDDSDISAARNGELGFVEMYGRENFNAAFLRNASRLHIGTQLTMLKKSNALRQDGGSEVQPIAGGVFVPSKLSLTPQKLNASSIGEEGTKDCIANSTKDIEFSGEWIRPRRYICKVCLARFNGFWEIEDHFWAKHPNVYHSFYEFPAEQDPGAEFLQTCKRSLSNSGVCGKADTKWSTSTPSSECTKCGLTITPIAEFHKHILECGGDTNWMSTMYTPTKKHKKWRPYSGHRRRRTVTKNRMCVRNIPEMPLKLPSQSKGKQKAGDSDSIQKMIANLPPKRKTRRVVNFDDVNRSRFLTRTSVMTRRRREQLDPKTSARVAKAFAVDNIDVMSIVRRNRKGSNVTLKVPASVKNDELSQKSLPVPSDPQPIVQVEAIKMEHTFEVNSDEAMVHTTCSSSSDHETSTSYEQNDCKVEINDIVSSEKTDVPIIEEAVQNLTSKSVVDIVSEKSPAEVAPSLVASSVNVLSVETPKDVSQIMAALEESVIAPSIKNSDITSPIEISKVVNSSSEGSHVTPRKVPAEAHADNVALASDKSPERILLTSEVTAASEEKPVGASSILETSDLMPSTLMADEKPVTLTSPVVDGVNEPCKKDTSLATMESSRPAGRQSPVLPDSSVILAAMADTFGQTDAVTPNTVYSGGKKRKRGSKQPKCKKCGSKSSRKQQLCVACTVQQQLQQKESQLVPPPQKKQVVHNNFLQFVCECCGSEVFSTAREGKICDMCLEKTISAKTENADELPTVPPSSDRICDDCGCAFSSNLTDILICDKCASCKVCGTCGDKFDVTSGATVCLKCSLAAAAASPPSKAQAMVTSMSTLVRVTAPEKVTEAKSTVCRLCSEMCANLSSDLCTQCQLKTSKQSHPTEKSITPKSSSKPRTDSQEITNAPKLKLETPSSPQLHIPSPDRLVDDNRCIHCNEQTNDRNDTGNPACRMCHELWITLNTDNLEPGLGTNSLNLECIECDVLRVNEATSQRYCEGCTATKNASLNSGGAFPLPTDRRRSSEASVQVGEFGGGSDSYSRVTKMPTLTPALPGVSTNPTSKPSDDPNSKLSATGTKNTLLLICKGCYGTYNTVSAYKEHRQQCPFRNSDDEASKKPLLGFAKRIKSGVEIVQVDSPGAASFEIDGGVLQMHDDSVGAGVGNVVPKIEPSENVSSQSTDLDATAAAKRFKAKIATDESIAETINSVIERFCSTSTPILKNENEIDHDSLSEHVPDLSDIAPNCSVLPSSSTSTFDKKASKRVRYKPVDSPTRESNMKVVEGEVEMYLESSKSKKITARKIFSFSDSSIDADASHLKEESTVESTTSLVNNDGMKRRSLPSKSGPLHEASTSDGVAIANSGKKRLRSTKSKSSGKTRVRQKSKSSGSNNNSAPASATISHPIFEEESMLNPQEIANVTKESPKSGCKKVLKKRRAEDDVLDQSSEVRLSSRLRRKSVLTDDMIASRVLRSKSKGDVSEEGKEDELLGSTKQEEESTKNKKSDSGLVPRSESNFKESASSDRRRNPSVDKVKTKLADSEIGPVESPVSDSVSTESEVKSSKPKGTKRKTDAKDPTTSANSKRVRSSSQDLGFSVAKTGKNVRSNVRVKDEDGKNAMDDFNQLTTSLAGDRMSTSSSKEPLPGQAESASAATPSNVSERGNFLGLGPSVPQSYLQVSSIGERPASAEGPKVRRTVAEEESMANQCRDLSNDLEQQHQLRFIESLSDSNFKDATEMQRIQQNLERSYSYVISMLNAVCEVLGSPEVSSANSLDPSVANELEELKKYADVASEAVLMLKNPKMEDTDFSLDFSSVIYETKDPPKLYCELESQTKHYKDFFIRKATNPPIRSKDQTIANKATAPAVNGTKTTPVKNGKLKSNKNQSNGVKKKLRCNHCQKVLPTKNEMTAHIQDHFRRFTTSKKDNAEMLKKCIADGFEQLLKDKAIDSFLKHSNVAESGLCAPLKILTDSRDNQLEKWKSVVEKLVEIETKANSELQNRIMSNANASARRVEQNVKNIEPSSDSDDSKSIISFERAKTEELYQCPMCSTTYEQKKLRDRHLMMVHTRHRSSQKFIFDLDSAKSARANLIADSCINPSTSTTNKAPTVATPARTVKRNGSMTAIATPKTSTAASSTVTSSPPSVTTTAEESPQKVDLSVPPPLTPPPPPKPDPASLPPPLLPANVEMPAPSCEAAAGRQSPPALTIASPIANSRPKTPPSSPILDATPPSAVLAKAASATTVPSQSRGVASGAAAAAAAALGAGTTPAVLTSPVRFMINGRRYRKKMSKKEMNIPDDVIKAKAEEALRELTGNRFYRI